MDKALRNIVNGTLILSVAGGLLISAQTPGEQYDIYYGLLHSHTAISDGSGTPEEAFQMAKKSGLDFFAVTPHNHKSAEFGAKADRRDKVLIATNNSLYNGNTEQIVTQEFESGDKTLKVVPLIMAAKEATDDNFLAIYGQEFSTISKGNHMNVFGVEEVIKASNGNYVSMLDLISQQSFKPVLQLNHPNVQSDLFYSGRNEKVKKRMFNDYGIDEADFGPHFKNLIAKMDEYVHLIEVFSGPAMQKTRIENYHDEDAHYNDYFFYLKQGFHISPSAGQDNHYKTWGMATDIRTGVYSKSLDVNDFYDALRNQRTFATEDLNSSVEISIGQAFMGSNLNTDAEEEIKIAVNFIDEDEPNEEVEFTLYGGFIESEDSRKATNVKQRDGRLLSGTLTTGKREVVLNQITSGDPEFYYVVVKQPDEDRTFSAPVWVNYPRDYLVATERSEDEDIPLTLFVWTKSKSSEVYHVEGCPSTNMIKEKNRETGFDPPANRRQHDCPVEEAIGH